MKPTDEQLKEIISAALTKQQKAILCLKEVEGLTDAEAATAMKLPVRLVRQLYEEAIVQGNAQRAAVENGIMTEAAFKVRMNDKAVLAQMTPKVREAMEMKYIEGLTIHQIATRLKKHTVSVGGRLMRGERVLKHFKN